MNPEIKDFFSHETMFTNSINIENYPVLCNVKGFMVKLFANMGSIIKKTIRNILTWKLNYRVF